MNTIEVIAKLNNKIEQKLGIPVVFSIDHLTLEEKEDRVPFVVVNTLNGGNLSKGLEAYNLGYSIYTGTSNVLSAYNYLNALEGVLWADRGIVVTDVSKDVYYTNDINVSEYRCDIKMQINIAKEEI